MASEAYVTLVTNDQYALGGLVLGASLKDSGTTRDLICMITNKLSSSLKEALGKVYTQVVEVDELNSHDEVNLALLCRPELGITLTKLFAWKLTQYRKAVFIDADCLVIRNVDELFERDELSAAPDVGWVDLFNSGVFVLRPSDDTFAALMQFAERHGSFDGGDQGVLNDFFSDVWSSDIKYKLSFTYNLNANASYFYRPAYQRYKDQIKILHFIGPGKPWLWARDTHGRVLDRADATFRIEHVQLWWDVHDGHAPQWGLGAVHYAAVDPRAAFRTEWVHGEAHHTHTPKNPKWDFSAIEQRLNELIHKGPYPS